MSELNVEDLSREELETKCAKYYSLSMIRKNRMLAYSAIIKSLTGKSAKNFISIQEEVWGVNGDAIAQFKREQDAEILSLQKELEETRRKIEESEKLSNLSKDSRKTHSDMKIVNDNQATVFSQYLQKNVCTSASELIMFRKEQSEIEVNIIDDCIENLRKIFDSLPKGIILIDIKTIEIEINPFLRICLDSRVRLSYFLDELKFVTFLRSHLIQMENVLNLFNSRNSNQSEKRLTIPLTSYEKRLIFYNAKTSDSYLTCYERPSEIQQRALSSQTFRLELETFSESDFQKIPSCFLFIQPEEAIRMMMITFAPINNLICVSYDNENKSPDSCSFYTLVKISPESRIWKSDMYAYQICVSFQHQYLQNASQCFRKFYHDIFGHNNYVVNFEKIFEEKTERWRQMKILLENIKIVSDNFMLGKLVRSVLFAHALYFPEPEIDIMINTIQPSGIQQEFKDAQARWLKGLPATEEESESWLSGCFDSYKTWSPRQTDAQYQQRWIFLLQSAKFQ